MEDTHNTKDIQNHIIYKNAMKKMRNSSNEIVTKKAEVQETVSSNSSENISNLVLMKKNKIQHTTKKKIIYISLKD